MKVVIIGHGRMGKEVQQILKERGHLATHIIEEANRDILQSINKSTADVAIEFTRPDMAFQNASVCIHNGIPIVSGTTGWNDKLDEIKQLCKDKDGTFLYASNFSIGMNIFFALNEKLAQMMNNQPQYHASIIETHHVHKKDKPSGTAVTLAEQVIENIDRYSEFTEEAKSANQLTVKAIREGEVFGKHEVHYNSNIDSIAISHNAESRRGFALGAVIAAEFIHNKMGVFTMKNVLGF